ncbi:MAG TPA: hypothetical protein VJ716_04545 [Gaiellaceae bacterium]|nr:hypothetical protein [Gaiellaceae bacterium]
MVSPIGPKDSDLRYRADNVLEYLIRPALEARPLSYDVRRADEEATPGIITNHIISRIVEADLVVADLSDGHANVFYELAVRHVARKPLVQLIRSDQELPFDVKAMRTVFYTLEDPRQLERNVAELQEFAKAATAGEPIETPISVALELKARRASGDPTEIALAELQEDVAALRADLRSMTARSQFPGLTSSLAEAAAAAGYRTAAQVAGRSLTTAALPDAAALVLGGRHDASILRSDPDASAS